MNRDELAKEVSEFIQSDEFKESGAFDAEGDVDFGPAGLAIQEFVEGLEEDEDDADENSGGGDPAEADPVEGSEK